MLYLEVNLVFPKHKYTLGINMVPLYVSVNDSFVLNTRFLRCQILWGEKSERHIHEVLITETSQMPQQLKHFLFCFARDSVRG
jgi:hypothetical protein